MFNSQTLEIASGLIFVYLIASLLASAVREIIESALKTRAIQLERGIRLLLDDPSGKSTTTALFSHPQLFSLFDGVYDPAHLTGHWRRWRKDETTRGGTLVSGRSLRLPFGCKLPSYIPSRNFALALLDLLARQGGSSPAAAAAGGTSMETLMAHASALAPSRLRDALIVALTEAQGDFDRARTSLEAWFDSNMDRVSGWYKRESQVILLIIGLVTAVLFNIDTIAITHRLADSNTVRAQVLLQAEATRVSIAERQKTLQSGQPMLDTQALNDVRKGLGDLIGWPDELPEHWSLPKAIGGWLLTGIAISLGAPFWFDLLNKIMVVRATVKPFQKSPSEGSEDRSGSTPPADRLAPVQPAGGAAQDGAHAPPAAGIPRGSVRLAVQVAGLTDLALTVDGAPVALPANGFCDLALEMGPDHVLRLTARDAGGQPVSWSDTVRVTPDDDALAVDAVLA